MAGDSSCDFHDSETQKLSGAVLGLITGLLSGGSIATSLLKDYSIVTETLGGVVGMVGGCILGYVTVGFFRQVQEKCIEKKEVLPTHTTPDTPLLHQ